MQHYGLPTRLLDWTESPLVAAYFAVCDPSNDNSPGALWVTQPSFLNAAESDREGIFESSHEDVQPLFKGAFQNPIEAIDKIAAVHCPERDIRMLVQLARFTVHGTSRPLEDHDQRERFLAKWEIPKEAKEYIRQQLTLMGIRRSVLFPDAQSLASELKDLSFVVQRDPPPPAAASE